MVHLMQLNTPVQTSVLITDHSDCYKKEKE